MNVVFTAVAGVPDPPEHTARDATLQVGAVSKRKIARERNPAVDGTGLARAERSHLSGEDLLETAGARCEELFHPKSVNGEQLTVTCD